MAAACSGGSPGAAVPPPSSTSTTPPATTSSSGPPPLKSIDASFDFGQDVIITPTGFRPAWLVSLVGKQITWWNESGHPQRVVFDHQGIRSTVIAPGAAWRYTPPTALSLSYHAGIGPAHAGKVQVTPSAQ